METEQTNKLIRIVAILLIILLVLLAGFIFFFLRNFYSAKPNYPVQTTVSPTITTTSAATTTNSFTVTEVDLTANPSTIQGIACGSNITIAYTATFHISPNSPGGLINFSYTTTNGRSSTPDSVIVDSGQTSKTFTFITTGVLTSDHTFPGTAELIVSNPNSTHSPQVQVAGTCK